METMASSGTAVVTLPTDTQILITREFDAPKHLVYKAYTTPELIKRWWSSKRGEMTVADVDLRVGGKWRFVMVTDGGFEVGFHGEYREIVPNERLVSTEVYEGAPIPEGGEEQPTLNTLTLAEKDGRTTLTVLVDAGIPEIRNAIIESGMEAGLQDALDLLEGVAISLR
ncbi:MAG: SRPBCC family protein [Actinomycetota bacterium]